MAMATNSGGQTTGPWAYGVVNFSFGCPGGYTYVDGPTPYCQLSQEFYVGVQAVPKSASDSTPTACVGDPINVATGAVIKSEGDCMATSPSQPSFSRIYSSSNSSSTNLGTGWLGNYSRRIDVDSVIAARRTYVANSPDNSTLFPSATAACTLGFSQINSRVITWAGAYAVYEENLCKIVKNSVVIGILPVYTNGGFPMSAPAPIGYEVTRDDGQVIRFSIQGGVITAPPGITLKLRLAVSGFSVTDANDNVETYDSAGVLQAITSRAGVTQTMSYDSGGRLITVTDSFGHKLILGYDPQNRVISVTRQ
jgi:YD repeat-containing protein